MKALIAAFLILSCPTAFAADAPKPPAAADAPKPPPEADVGLTALDLQIAAVAVVNAGAACDGGTKVYCSLVGDARDTLMKKLQEAFASLQPKPPAK